MPKKNKKKFFLRLFIFREIRSLIFGKSSVIKLIIFVALAFYLIPKYPIFSDKAHYYYQTIILNKIKDNHQILGVVRVNEGKVTQIVSKNYNNIDRIKNEIKRLTWVEEVSVRRDLKNKNLIIEIEEYEPFAIYEKNAKRILIDKKGNNIKDYENEIFDNMIFLKGIDADKNAKSLINVVSANYHLGNGVYSATWIGGRRWDIRLDNNILIKLPEKKIQEALNKLLKIYQTPGALLGLEVVDLRVVNKIYLQYVEGTFPRYFE